MATFTCESESSPFQTTPTFYNLFASVSVPSLGASPASSSSSKDRPADRNASVASFGSPRGSTLGRRSSHPHQIKRKAVPRLSDDELIDLMTYGSGSSSSSSSSDSKLEISVEQLAGSSISEPASPTSSFTSDNSYKTDSSDLDPSYYSRFGDVASGHRTPTFEVHDFHFPLPPPVPRKDGAMSASGDKTAVTFAACGVHGEGECRSLHEAHDTRGAALSQSRDLRARGPAIDHRATTIVEEEEDADLEETRDHNGEVLEKSVEPAATHVDTRSSRGSFSSSDILSPYSVAESYFDGHYMTYAQRPNSVASTNSTSQSIHNLAVPQGPQTIAHSTQKPQDPSEVTPVSSPSSKDQGASASKLVLLLGNVRAAGSSCLTLGRSSDSSESDLSGQKKKERAPKKTFSRFAKPTQSELEAVAHATVFTEEGTEIKFGALFQDSRTIVCFIRHYWCPSCQDYVSSLMKVNPEQLRQHDIKLVVVGCGSWKMISGYRKLLGGCAFQIVSDPSRTVYKHFGMTQSSAAPGRRPAYVQHNYAANTLISLKRNLAMPLKSPGDLNALGGEFVIGPGPHCAFAHRMSNTRDHAELADILKAIGVIHPEHVPELSLQT